MNKIEIRQEDFDTAELAIISLIRNEYPNLDLKRGTILREHLVRPAAILYANNSNRILDLKKATSIATTDDDNLDNLLVNFNIKAKLGTKAKGNIRVYLSGESSYVIPKGFEFSNATGLIYYTENQYTANVNNTGDVKLYKDNDSSFVIIPIVASSVGSEYNMPEHAQLSAVSSLYGYSSAFTDTAFTSGSDGEKRSDIIERLPSILSSRGMVNSDSIANILRHNFDNILRLDVSALGLGSLGMLRDSRNKLGISVGSRSDVYVRTFNSPDVVAIDAVGVNTDDGKYLISLDSLVSAGVYSVKSVTDYSTSLSSYIFTETRRGSGNYDNHDIEDNRAEVQGTIYQNIDITVSNVNSKEPEINFRVELYKPNSISMIQNYIDRPDVRNIGTDFVVRSPLICLVSCSLTAYCKFGSDLTIDSIKHEIADVINSKSFVPRLSRSSIVNRLMELGVTRLDLDYKFNMAGRILDNYGNWHRLEGDTIDITSLPKSARVLPEMVVFSAELSSLHVTKVEE